MYGLIGWKSWAVTLRLPGRGFEVGLNTWAVEGLLGSET